LHSIFWSLIAICFDDSGKLKVEPGQFHLLIGFMFAILGPAFQRHKIKTIPPIGAIDMDLISELIAVISLVQKSFKAVIHCQRLRILHRSLDRICETLGEREME
jgi:hypothetical protein